MSNDVNCPYCGADVEINHDDGYGREEDRKHEQTCHQCDKTFVFTTMISFRYDAEKAPCLNGEAHDMQPVVHYPALFPQWKRCSCCEHEENGDLVKPVDTPRKAEGV